MNIVKLDAEAIYAALRDDIARALASKPDRRPHLIGIHSGGAWIAERVGAIVGHGDGTTKGKRPGRRVNNEAGVAGVRK